MQIIEAKVNAFTVLYETKKGFCVRSLIRRKVGA